MGEIAEMMLDGTMCQSCGEWMDGGGDGPGYPQTCAGCGGDVKPLAYSAERAAKNLSCPICRRRFRERAHMEQHAHDKHCPDHVRGVGIT